jgi:hypothetical protein
VDRRQTPRFGFTSSIELRAASGTIFRGIARDLSVRGLGGIVSADLQVGDSVLIRYAHPHTPTTVNVVARHARVKARYGNRYGFEFHDQVDVAPNICAS